MRLILGSSGVIPRLVIGPPAHRSETVCDCVGGSSFERKICRTAPSDGGSLDPGPDLVRFVASDQVGCPPIRELSSNGKSRGNNGYRGDLTTRLLGHREHGHWKRRGSDFHRSLIVAQGDSEEQVVVQKGRFGLQRRKHEFLLTQNLLAFLILESKRYFGRIGLAWVEDRDTTLELIIHKPEESDLMGGNVG